MSQLINVRSNNVPDVCALWLSLASAAYFSSYAVEGVRFLRVLEMRLSLGNILALGAVTFAWLVLFSTPAIYHWINFDKRGIGRRFSIAILALIGVLLLGGVSLLLDWRLFARDFWFWFYPLYVLLAPTLRFVHSRSIRWLDPKSRYQIRMVALGSGRVLDLAVSNYLRTTRFLGYFGDLTNKYAPCLGPVESLSDYLRREVVDVLLVTQPASSLSKEVLAAVHSAEAMGVTVLYPLAHLQDELPLPKPLSPRVSLARARDGWVALSFDSGPFFGWTFSLKRVSDIVAALLLVILLAPVLLMVTLAIVVTMGRPVFFMQKRLGYHRRVFEVFKFRTMIANADAMRATLLSQNEREGAAFKMTNDPRVTKLGRFLRRTSLDELPQLFNVLKGDMSLVGPRPLPMDDYARVTNEAYLRRLSVLPGITGPWQVSDRDRISFADWMNMELDYIDHWSLNLDVMILIKTVWVVLAGTGAK